MSGGEPDRGEGDSGHLQARFDDDGVVVRTRPEIFDRGTMATTTKESGSNNDGTRLTNKGDGIAEAAAGGGGVSEKKVLESKTTKRK